MSNFALTELPENHAARAPRTAEVVRNTAETNITVRVNRTAPASRACTPALVFLTTCSTRLLATA